MSAARCVLILALVAPGIVAGQEAEPTAPATRLSLKRLYTDLEFAPQGAPTTAWLGAGDRYTTLESSASVEDGFDLVAWDVSRGASEVLVTAAQLTIADGAALDIAGYQWSADQSKLLIFTNTRRVWRRNTRGDYWLLDRDAGELRRIGAGFEESSLMFAKLSPRGDAVAFVHAHDLYVEWLGDGRLQRLTQDGSDIIINGTFDWAYEEELDLKDGFRWSSDGARIAFWRLDASAVRDYVLVDSTSELYPTLKTFPYPKVGENNSSARIGVVEVASGATTWLKVESSISDGYLARMMWLDDPAEVMVQRINRAQNELTVFVCSPDDGTCRPILVERDDAWVDIHDDPAMTADQQRFTWLSQRGGWRHLYLAQRSGAAPRLLTPGDWDVIDLVAVTDDSAFFIASPDAATQRYLYAVDLEGGGVARRLTPATQAGTHSYDIAPNGAFAFHTWSSAEHVPVTELVNLPDHAPLRTLVDNAELATKVAALDGPAKEFFLLEIADGVKLDGWMLRPPAFDPDRVYPVLWYVYGEPSSLTVRDRWGRDGDLWHRFLAQQGYVIMSVDNRGTPSPKGREWRKMMHGAVGVLSSADQAAAVRAAVKRWSWVDPERIGVWGWSGGGSMTLNLMFRSPQLYRVGLAVAPVPDQRLYDTIYQERYSGLLPEFEEGYRQGSPITFAHQLEGDLLIVHGTGDDNVHYQGTERLINELIRHNKSFAMMAYPNRGHGIYEGEGTTRHVRELLYRYLTEHLPAGPKEVATALVALE